MEISKKKLTATIVSIIAIVTIVCELLFGDLVG